MEKTAIVQLAEAVQKETGENIVARVTGKKGADHEPTVFVEIEMPNGAVYSASGKNKKQAKNKAANEALEKMGWV